MSNNTYLYDSGVQDADLDLDAAALSEHYQEVLKRFVAGSIAKLEPHDADIIVVTMPVGMPHEEAELGKQAIHSFTESYFSRFGVGLAFLIVCDGVAVGPVIRPTGAGNVH